MKQSGSNSSGWIQDPLKQLSTASSVSSSSGWIQDPLKPAQHRLFREVGPFATASSVSSSSGWIQDPLKPAQHRLFREVGPFAWDRHRSGRRSSARKVEQRREDLMPNAAATGSSLYEALYETLIGASTKDGSSAATSENTLYMAEAATGSRKMAIRAADELMISLASSGVLILSTAVGDPVMPANFFANATIPFASRGPSYSSATPLLNVLIVGYPETSNRFASDG
eukprot:CAMPEP_0119401898 /NCGR_PEP_ID=MMETSP1334-20130426/142603_1 /TAXON_ID=127549 /ORGANISM="Calcidiscus leptoporus, Strain RCC1130" /LENGTH=226 /DNA_ID=CAMNT_0007425821 /DNA_START=439 /DNA_END=1121 /DNA_ORIENTATION=+